MKKLLLLLVVGFCLASCGGDSSQDSSPKQPDNTAKEPSQKEKPAKKLDSKAFQESVFSEPSPGESLLALNKLGDIAWNDYASYATKTTYDNHYAQALNLGVRIADAFAAFNAKDQENLQKMTDAIANVGQQLKLGEDITKYKGEADKLIAAKNWKKLKSEVENISGAIYMKAKEEKQETGILTSVAAWIEGVQIIGKHLEANYNKEHAKVLQQGDLASYYVEALTKLGASAKANSLVQEVSSEVAKISTMLQQTQNAPLALEDIKKLNEMTSKLVKSITK